jgi:hypothetical protein
VHRPEHCTGLSPLAKPEIRPRISPANRSGIRICGARRNQHRASVARTPLPKKATMAPTNAVQGLPLGTINESTHRQSEPFPQMVGPFRHAWKPLAVGAGLFRRGSYSGLPADGSQRSACELTGDFAKTSGTNSCTYRTLRGGDWGHPNFAPPPGSTMEKYRSARVGFRSGQIAPIAFSAISGRPLRNALP